MTQPKYIFCKAPSPDDLLFQMAIKQGAQIVFDHAPFNEQVRFIDSIISLKEKWESNGEETTEES